jgi:hypothetical protein
MHTVLSSACRRTAGWTAGLVLGAGLAGGVLLTPGTALADTAVATTTVITGTTQTPGFIGTTLDVQVSVTPASGTAWPSGTVTVSDGSASCQVTLAQDGSKAAGVGDCKFYGLRSGRYTLTATYGGSSVFASSTSAPAWVTVGPEHHRAVLATGLSCTAKVFAGRQGSCTLSVTNAGRFSAPDVTAQVSLPSQLRARYCGQFWAHQGCTISGNAASEDLGTLRPGQTRTLSVVFTARPGFSLWGWHHKHRITVKVIGSAASDPDFRGPGARSYSAAYVTIIPWGWW